MGQIKGAKEYRKFKQGKSLTRKEAILAMCYQCNGKEESHVDCQGYSCPLYQYSPYHNREWVRRNIENQRKPHLQPRESILETV